MVTALYVVRKPMKKQRVLQDLYDIKKALPLPGSSLTSDPAAVNPLHFPEMRRF
jgi:hypothetical protein